MKTTFITGKALDYCKDTESMMAKRDKYLKTLTELIVRYGIPIQESEIMLYLKLERVRMNIMPSILQSIKLI